MILATLVTTALSFALPITSFGLLAGAVIAYFYLPLFGKQSAAALAILAAATFAYDLGFSERASLDKSAVLSSQIVGLKADIAELQRQADAANQIASDAKMAEQNAEDHAAINEQKVDEYVAELAKRKTPACGLSDVDVGRLRGIGAARRPVTAPEPAARPADLRPISSGSDSP